jgi:DNA (cytosine-5)-methyltransferase 1
MRSCRIEGKQNEGEASVRKGSKIKRKADEHRARKSEILACDLFSGAGGFSLGAHLAGIRVAAAVEWDKYACKTYRSNLIDTGLTSTLLFETDIATLGPAKVKSATGFTDNPCDILLGGPPCQGFSAHRLKNSGVNDPRNTLLLRYFEYVRILRPAFFW